MSKKSRGKDEDQDRPRGCDHTGKWEDRGDHMALVCTRGGCGITMEIKPK